MVRDGFVGAEGDERLAGEPDRDDAVEVAEAYAAAVEFRRPVAEFDEVVLQVLPLERPAVEGLQRLDGAAEAADAGDEHRAAEPAADRHHVSAEADAIGGGAERLDPFLEQPVAIGREQRRIHSPHPSLENQGPAQDQGGAASHHAADVGKVRGRVGQWLRSPRGSPRRWPRPSGGTVPR